MQAAELGSFTKAAEKLGYSQSTISFQIKQLETSLGIQLFERINHTVSLTEHGREVLQYAHRISGMTQELEKQIQRQARGEQAVQGHIRIAMADSLCNWLLKDRFSRFREKFPGITVKIVAASTEEMFRLLNHNEVDLVYTLDNHIYNRDYVIVREEKISTHFVAGKNHPLLMKRERGAQENGFVIEDVLAYPFMMTEKGMSYRKALDEKLASMSFAIDPVLEVGNADLICRLVSQEATLSFLPDFVTEEAVREGKLSYIKVAGFEIEMWKQLLYHRDKWVLPQMKAVMENLF